MGEPHDPLYPEEIADDETEIRLSWVAGKWVNPKALAASLRSRWERIERGIADQQIRVTRFNKRLADWKNRNAPAVGAAQGDEP